jgi:hypothetical protein
VGAAFIPSSTRRFGGLSATMATATARRLVPTGRTRTSTFAPVVRDDDSVSPLSRARESPTSVNRAFDSVSTADARARNLRRSIRRSRVAMRPRALERELPAVSGAPTRGALPASARRVLTQSLNDGCVRLSCRLQKSVGTTRAHCVSIRKTLFVKGGC